LSEKVDNNGGKSQKQTQVLNNGKYNENIFSSSLTHFLKIAFFKATSEKLNNVFKLVRFDMFKR
jgi:hypothetical protein